MRKQWLLWNIQLLLSSWRERFSHLGHWKSKWLCCFECGNATETVTTTRSITSLHSFIAQWWCVQINITYLSQILLSEFCSQLTNASTAKDEVTTSSFSKIIPGVKLRRMHENQLDMKSKKQKQLPLTTTSLCRAIIINCIDDQELSVVKCSYK